MERTSDVRLWYGHVKNWSDAAPWGAIPGAFVEAVRKPTLVDPCAAWCSGKVEENRLALDWGPRGQAPEWVSAH